MKSMEEMIQAAQKAAETIQKQMTETQSKLDSVEVEGVAGFGEHAGDSLSRSLDPRFPLH